MDLSHQLLWVAIGILLPSLMISLVVNMLILFVRSQIFWLPLRIFCEFYGKYDKTGWNPRPFTIYLHEYDIEVQYTMYDTPQQNDIDERRNCTLLDMVRSVLENSSLLDYLWEEALRMSAYILNQVLSKYVPKTPFEPWSRRKANLHHFRVWGCKAKVQIYNS